MTTWSKIDHFALYAVIANFDQDHNEVKILRNY